MSLGKTFYSKDTLFCISIGTPPFMLETIWLSGCPMKGHFRAKSAKNAFLALKLPFIGQPDNHIG